MTQPPPVRYEPAGATATIRMDDGKANALSIDMFSALHDAFDRAERERAVVVLTGRAQTFSAGFDLKVFASGDARHIHAMLKIGADLAARILAFPTPVIAACNGNAVAMGAFLLLAADVRIGVEGPFKLGLNEVAIGMTVPKFGVELARQRLTPAYFNRTLTTGQLLSPEQAASAGFLDWAVAPDHFAQAIDETAAALAKINLDAHAATKLRARASSIAAVREAIDSEIKLPRA
jgi:enoyl-CoA hydratase